MKKQSLTPSEKLWIEVFGVRGLPDLDEEKVMAIIDGLPERERTVVRLRFGFGRHRPLSFEAIGARLSRSRETVRLNFRQARRHLRHPSLRRDWVDARR